MFAVRTSVPEGTFIELVQSLFRTVLPTAIIAITFTGVAAVVSFQTPDSVLWALTILGLISLAGRVGTLLYFRRSVFEAEMSLPGARKVERIFAASYLSFAVSLGLFSAWALHVAALEAHALVIALVVGYAAGVAAGAFYRPWISVTAMLSGVAPTILASFLSVNPLSWALGALLLILLGGGMENIVSRYRVASRGITMKRLFADMAERDVLTGLLNRFGLGERFSQETAMRRDTSDIAVHCLDLDRFKPVNDRYGHPVGDLVLQAVAKRLTATLRGHDFVARVGGDEFVVVQLNIAAPRDAEQLAERIVRVIAEPIGIGDQTITIGASIGFVLVSEAGPALDELIAQADEALLRSKAAGGARASAGARLRLAG